MRRGERFFGLAVCLAGVLTPHAGVRGQQAPTGISLSVSRETAPPGGMAQVKVYITEPKPISTGGGSFTFEAYESVDGIALMNELEDVTGVALVRGSQVALRFTSPSSTFGLDPDYPVLTVAGRVPADTPLGTKYRLFFDPGTLQLADPDGNWYVVETKPGHLVAWPGVSIHDVNPGSAVVAGGGVVTLTGSGFEPGTDVKFSEVKLSSVRFVSPTRIDVTLAKEARMHGQLIRASNPDGTRSIYFSYQRTYPMALPDDPLLRYAVPLLPPRAVTEAAIPFPPPDPAATYGIAVQNVEKLDATVSAELVDAWGSTVAAVPFSVTPDHYVVRLLTDLFGGVPPADCTVRITSDVPVQIMGIAADQITGTASPIVAR